MGMSGWGVSGWLRQLRWLLTDPATWRDLLWLVLNIPVGTVLGLLPAALLIVCTGTVAAGSAGRTRARILVHFQAIHTSFWAGTPIAIGALMLYLGGSTGGLVRTRLWHSREFPRPRTPPPGRELAARVGKLTESPGAEVVDDSAAELRRIERDLHDGAQARLASLGMSIGLGREAAAGTDPDQAQQLLAQARESRRPRWPNCARWCAASTRPCWPSAGWWTRSAPSPLTPRSGRRRRRFPPVLNGRWSPPSTSRSPSCW